MPESKEPGYRQARANLKLFQNSRGNKAGTTQNMACRQKQERPGKGVVLRKEN
jgi:hypothetical protein